MQCLRHHLCFQSIGTGYPYGHTNLRHNSMGVPGIPSCFDLVNSNLPHSNNVRYLPASNFGLAQRHSDENKIHEGSSMRSRPVWKSSILPSLFHGLEDQELRRSAPTRLAHIHEMEDRAKSSQARFAQRKDGWKLTKVA